MTSSSAFVAHGHGYEISERGRCTVFDPYEILANPLGGDTSAARESRTFPGRSGGPGVTYASHEVYLLREREPYCGTRRLFVAVHNGSGRYVWRLPTCSGYADETAAALLAMPERALYSLLYGITSALADTKRATERDTADDWRRATVDKRVKVSRQPSKGRAFVWIEPAPVEGETERQHAIRVALAKPAGVR